MCSSDTDELVFHEYSKTLKNNHRHLFQSRPDKFVEHVNAWLTAEPGLWTVTYLIARDRNGLVSEITFTCRAAMAPAPVVFSMDRVVLAVGLLARRRVQVDHALNDWREQHPEKRIVTHTVYVRNGVPMELWLLAAHAWPTG